MAGSDPERRAAGPRVSVGVPELDEMLEGGLMPRRPYLVVGPAGTGKTTLALQFLTEGIRRGERSLYVTVEDPPNEVLLNHRALRPLLDKVDVFDAIPDVMRYEHTPFKDIAAVRSVAPFGSIPERIRQTPEFTSVEITGTALEQLLRTEVQKRGYSRLVIDSLTALQYFCMKGFDPTVGAQTFIRFLTDLRTTTILTVEAPLEDVESPERMLARGEIRLFRWEYDNSTVRAIGVEKFRGSSHDIRLHPYRIGPRGIAIQLGSTISRDTRQLVGPAIAVALEAEAAGEPPSAELPLAETLSDQIRDLVVLGIDVAPLRTEVEAAVAAAEAGHREALLAHISRVSALVVSLAPADRLVGIDPAERSTPFGQALQRVRGRADRARAGIRPTVLPSPDLLRHELGSILLLVTAPAGPPTQPRPAAPSVPGEPIAPGPPSPAIAPAPPQVVEASPVDRGPIEPSVPPPPAAVTYRPPETALPLEPEPRSEGAAVPETPREEPVEVAAEAAAPGPSVRPGSEEGVRAQTTEPPVAFAGPAEAPRPPIEPEAVTREEPTTAEPHAPEVVARSAAARPTEEPPVPSAPPAPYEAPPPPSLTRGLARPAPPAVEMAEGGPPPHRRGAARGARVWPPPPVPDHRASGTRTRPAPSAEPSPPPETPSYRGRTRAAPPPPPPPLPSVGAFPGPGGPDLGSAALTPRPPKPTIPTVAPAAPRRRRASPAKRSSSMPTTPEAGGTAEPPAAAKPKRRGVRRKKAPPVVSSAPVGPSAEAPPPEGAPAEPPPPAPPETPSSEPR